MYKYLSKDVYNIPVGYIVSGILTKLHWLTNFYPEKVTPGIHKNDPLCHPYYTINIQYG